MTTLSARYVRQPRSQYSCDLCCKRISGPYIRLYGMADREPPWTLRLHPGCVQTAPGKDGKIDAALEKARGSEGIV